MSEISVGVHGHDYRNLDRMALAKQDALWQRGQRLLDKLDNGEAF
ncbi:hypothetical protein [Pseudomonas sp. SWRI99]|nr:hypothetical protein [Pseudomonas sp. SWRI99]